MSKLDNPYASLPSNPPAPHPTIQAPSLPVHGAGSPLISDDVVYPHYGEEHPPEFTPYETESFTTGDGDVVSHDPHLNEDGEALYRFLLSQASKPPTFILHVKGTHTEFRTRSAYRDRNRDGRQHNESRINREESTETETETITDFDFRIDLTRHLLPVTHWTAADSEPAYRGKMVREVEEQDGFSLQKRAATGKEREVIDHLRKYRVENGLPPWVQVEERVIVMEDRPIGPVYKSSRTVRQWADDYCASDKLLKEFIYEKMIYGWNLAGLQKSTETLIQSTHYTGTLDVSFDVTATKVFVRPTNRLSRTLSNKWIKFLLWILLIYPFIWLFKRFHSRGGGQWRVAGGAYATKAWDHVKDSVEGEDVTQYLARKQDSSPELPEYSAVTSTSDTRGSKGIKTSTALPGPGIYTGRLRRTPQGIIKLVGVREGEWFKEWDGTIRRAVIARQQSQEPMYQPDSVQRDTSGAALDGFFD